jgi:response regulator RpfG family c-di-GMP phosphodiesterase
MTNRDTNHPNPKDTGAIVEAGDNASVAQTVLQDLVSQSVIAVEDWESLPAQTRDELERCSAKEPFLDGLCRHGILSAYQLDRIKAGHVFELTLGNYRILDRLGAGGMGVVFKAEHRYLRLPVALKVLAASPGERVPSLERFFQEMRAVAQLHHPNIVAAVDAGEAPGMGLDTPTRHYFVMEYIPGQDLEEHVRAHGPLGVAEACRLAHQVASALAEAHKHNLIHRDVKPSNIRVTPEGQAKLLDFGLAAPFSRRLTEPGTLLGSVDYMAPEQARDASSVDIRADIYGLGGTLFWCLTGRPPFASEGKLAWDIVRRQTQPAPSVRAFRQESSPELDAVVGRMMALDPDDRYPTPQVLMRALFPFLHDREFRPSRRSFPVVGPTFSGSPEEHHQTHHVLVVDDDGVMRTFARHALQAEGMGCDVVVDGEQALQAAYANHYDLILLDVHLPGKSGIEICQHIRSAPPAPHLKIIMCSGDCADEMAQMLGVGADDFLTKPFSIVQLQARVLAALRLKDAQDRSDLLNHDLLAINQELEQNLDVRDGDLVHARNALALALAKLVAYRDTETGAHLNRLQRYSRCLAEEAATVPAFASQIDRNFIDLLECCAPLHDIGKVGLPDYILLKPGKLEPDERILMQTHTTIGADTLQEVARQHGFALAFLKMAADIARHHHEYYDGHGYPDHLTGDNIPLAARLVAVGDVYDALRSRRVYKPSLSHAATLQMMSESFHGQFDPALMPVFQRCALRFDKIFHETPN